MLLSIIARLRVSARKAGGQDAHAPCSAIARLHLSAPVALAAAFAFGPFAPFTAGAEEVNLYSHRHYEEDDRIFALFTERTGITVNVVKAEADQLMERLASEGAASPADLLITVDAGRLHRAKTEGLLQPIQSEALERAVPEHLRDPDGHWFGFTTRARALIYAPDRVQPAELSTYEALAERQWRGRILTRSSTNIYNQSLLASIIAASDAATAGQWARAVRGNMARPPQGNDRDQIRAVAAGLADVAIANTYYLGLMLVSDDPADRAAAAKVAVFFPNQGEGQRGTHINVSGAGVVKHAKNPEAAVKLLEFLTSPEVQKRYASANHEYPLSMEIDGSEILASWGAFKADPLPLGRLGELNAEAVRIFDRVGWE